MEDLKWPSSNWRNWAELLLSVNGMSMVLINCTLALHVLDLAVFMRRGIYFNTSSAVTAFRVTLWLDDRLSGVLSQTAVCEKGGSGEAARSIRFLSPQQSIIIVYISPQNSLVNSSQHPGKINDHILDVYCMFFKVWTIWIKFSRRMHKRLWMGLRAFDSLHTAVRCR